MEKTPGVFLYKSVDLVVYAHLKCYNIGMRLDVDEIVQMFPQRWMELVPVVQASLEDYKIGESFPDIWIE